MDQLTERERSWDVEGATLTLLRAVTAAGYTVSVHRTMGSLLGVPGAIEMHAVGEDEQLHSARVADDECRPGEDQEWTAAVMLAELVGVGGE